MLFDERELRIFATEESRSYFSDILQTYYSKNYRATTVLLYSFVIYDLFEKIKVMADEGNTEAKNIVAEIKKDFLNNEKYSEIENKILNFFTSKFSSYFKRFSLDIEYLKEYRHKSAHLNLDGSSLFVPKDYQVRMLICSMYDNVFSVKAPFITDLFQFVQRDIENFSAARTTINDELCKRLENDYYSRMTDDSISKSLHTFIKLLFASDDKEAIENAHGLLVFAYSLSIYALNRGLDSIFTEQKMHDLIPRINFDNILKSEERKQAFIYMICNVNAFEKSIRYKNSTLFSGAVKELFRYSDSFIQYFSRIFTRKNDSKFLYFMSHNAEIYVTDNKKIFEYLSDDPKFSSSDLILALCSKIPTFNGFAYADNFMDLFISIFQDLPIETIEKVFEMYFSNSQLYNRSRHSNDIALIKEKNSNLKTSLNLSRIPYFGEES